MKFGKHILSQQISGWGTFYLDYKFLKKIINSLEKGRLADAALFATGVRPEYGGVNGEPTEAGTPPDPQLLPKIEGSDELQIHKAAFFFKLQRELEKINTFYLQKEAELKARLKTLIDKKRLIFQARNSAKLSKESPSYVALYEGFRYFEKDLSKLQQFIEINATGFRKILKKWDKRSKSQTKELYLARQVEVQPCFNREFIAELSDIAAANLLELENLSHGRGWADSANAAANGDLSSEKKLDFAAAQSQDFDALADLEANLAEAIKAGRVAPAAEMVRIAAQNEDSTSVSRIVWQALLESPAPAVEAALKQGLADYGFVDDISSRTCLHEAALAGKIQLVRACVDNGVDVAKQDIYGRTALSYAAMTGHVDVCKHLLSLPTVTAATYDLDGFSPLVLAVMNGKTPAVKILLDHGASVEPRDTTDLIPLCLACSGGHVEITRLLLQKGARITSNAEGLYPQALAARAGHVDCLKLLVESGGDLDAPEKGTQWTPIFFAAENGHVECLRVLLDAGCRVSVVDEKGRNAAFYAAWNGKIACLLLLLQAAQKAGPELDTTEASPAAKSAATTSKADGGGGGGDEPMDDLDLDGEMDGIPSLSLPPPIIPFRTYGHNYLDKRTLVSVSLSNNSVRLYKQQDPNRPEQFSTSSLKLVMTSRPGESNSAIPHNVVLPLADEREVFSFQVDSLDTFSIEWELMPTFGSKVIGKAVALPSSFEGMTDRKRFVLPLQDVYLKVVGEVSFELDFVKPFDSVQLEIGGRVETYWKSMLPSTSSSGGVSGAGPTRMTPNSGVGVGASSILGQHFDSTTAESAATAATASTTATTTTTTTASAASHLATPATAGPSQPTLVTGSSISGEYLRIVVQVTRDGVAVAWPHNFVPLKDIQIYVGSVTAAEFFALARSTSTLFDWDRAKAEQASWSDWKTALKASVAPLDRLFEVLPVTIGVDIEVMYPSTAEVRSKPGMPKMEVNQFVDTILHTVYAAATHHKQESRKILFSSGSPTVCTALNWKQPNYPVFFGSHCGISGESSLCGILEPTTRHETDPRRESISEAARFAKSNNLLGIMVEVALLDHVPSLIQSVKAAGLLLITIGKKRGVGGAIGTDALGGRAGTEGSSEGRVEDVDGEVVDGLVVCCS